MIFDRTERIKLLSEPIGSYPEAQARSKELDQTFGFETERVETLLQSLQPQASAMVEQRWIGLATQALLTPYSELAEIVRRLSSWATGPRLWVDLGAAYGRLAIVLDAFAPLAHFIGYELVKERVDEGRRTLANLGLSHMRLETQDLADPQFVPPPAHYYFLYDFGSQSAIGKTLLDLKKIASQRMITVIARGRGARNLIDRDHPWLSQVKPPEHFPAYSIYRS